MTGPARFPARAAERRRRRRGIWRAADIGPAETGGDPRAAALALLARRAPGATICPSEVARAIAAASGADWRDSMPEVHAAVDALAAEGLVRLSWKGRPKAVRDGPYRIGRPTR